MCPWILSSAVVLVNEVVGSSLRLKCLHLQSHYGQGRSISAVSLELRVIFSQPAIRAAIQLPTQSHLGSSEHLKCLQRAGRNDM